MQFDLCLSVLFSVVLNVQLIRAILLQSSSPSSPQLPIENQHGVSINNSEEINFTLKFHQLDSSNRTAKRCHDMMKNFTKSLAEFDACALMNTIPYKVCLTCSNYYRILVEQYTVLNDSWKNSTCPSDPASTFQLTFLDSQNTWTRGNCDDCFTEINGSYIESPNTLVFGNKVVNLVHCFTTSANVCSECKSIFQDTGDFYNQLYWSDGRSICSDLNYLLNQAVDLWKYKYSCEINVEPSIFLLAMIAMVVIGTFAFYLCLRLTQKPHSNRPTLTENRFSFSVNSKGLNEYTPLIGNGNSS